VEGKAWVRLGPGRGEQWRRRPFGPTLAGPPPCSTVTRRTHDPPSSPEVVGEHALADLEGVLGSQPTVLAGGTADAPSC